jgi:hypothetical protein
MEIGRKVTPRRQSARDSHTKVPSFSCVRFECNLVEARLLTYSPRQTDLEGKHVSHRSVICALHRASENICNHGRHRGRKNGCNFSLSTFTDEFLLNVLIVRDMCT